MAQSDSGYFELAYRKLDDMETEKKVDLSILGIFETLQNSFTEHESYWKVSRSIPIKEAFVLFHSMRNCRLILQRMGLEFRRAEEKHQNPQIVYSARLVLPRIHDLCNMIGILKGKEITGASIELVRKRLKLLRDVAETTSMLPTVDDETKGVMRIDLEKKFEAIAAGLQARVSEE